MGSEEALRTSVCQLGLIPGELLRGVPPGTPIPIGQDQLGHMLYCDRVVSAAPHRGAVLTSMFMHGGWFRLLCNSSSPRVVGNNTDGSTGPARRGLRCLSCG